MKPSKIKDKIIDCLIEQNGGGSSEKIAHKLNIEHHTVYALCNEMAKAGHIKTISMANANYIYGYSITLKVPTKITVEAQDTLSAKQKVDSSSKFK